MIPENKQAAVKNALQTIFEADGFEDIRELTAGLSSALVFRIILKKKPYLLRIITRDDDFGDPTNQFTHMKSAAEVGIAPRVLYTSVKDRVSITDFVETAPLSIDEARMKLPVLLRRLHALSPFQKLNNPHSMDSFVNRFKESKILPDSTIDELFGLYAQIETVYPKNTDLVSCHNDLKPENILFDGEKIWLVDWEAAFLNDRYADLAIVANFVVNNDSEEAEYLAGYFGKEADEYQKNRFFLMRQITHMSYVAIFMLIASGGKPISPNMEKLDFRDFHNRIWTGEISLSDNDAKLQYAWVHLNKLLNNMKTKKFEDALRIVSDCNAN